MQKGTMIHVDPMQPLNPWTTNPLYVGHTTSYTSIVIHVSTVAFHIRAYKKCVCWQEANSHHCTRMIRCLKSRTLDLGQWCRYRTSALMPLGGEGRRRQQLQLVRNPFLPLCYPSYNHNSRSRGMRLL